jgi:hypothetical protein
MDRAIVYTSALPQTLDMLNTNKFGMIAQAFLNAAVINNGTAVNGLAVTPISPTANLNVNVGVGSIYQIEEVDATAYSDLGTDTNSIVKQGILYNPVTLAITPPGTVGFSQVYLVEAIYNDVDAGSLVLPYYNSNNVAQPYQGPGNNQQAQYTSRTGVCVIALKAGVAAATGSQVRPTPDAGYTPLYYITVANGQTQITSANIVLSTAAPFFPALLQVPPDVQGNVWTYAVDTAVAAANMTTNAGTTTSSGVLHFASNPPAAIVGMFAYDVTTPTAITGGQTVSSVGTGTATLSANVNVAVGSSDVIAFSNDAYLATLYPPPASLYAGLEVNLKVGSTNTGSATLNLNGLGAVAIKRPNGANLVGGDMYAGSVARLIHDGTFWQLQNYGGLGGGGTNTNTTNIISIPYAPDTGSVNTMAAAFTPAITSLAAGLVVLVKVGHTNTGGMTLACNALGAVAVTDSNGNAVAPGALVAGEMALLEYDGTEFQCAQANSTVMAGSFLNLIGQAVGSTKTITYTIGAIQAVTAFGGSTFTGQNLSLSFNGATTGANGMDTGSMPTGGPGVSGGDLMVYAIYNQTTKTWATLGCTYATSHGLYYTGSNLPSGYSASVLIGAYCNDSSANVFVFYQQNRTVYIPSVNTLTNGAATSPTPVTMYGKVPQAATSISGNWDGVSSTGSTSGYGIFLGGSTGSGFGGTGMIGFQWLGGYGSDSADYGPVPCIVPSTYYYYCAANSYVSIATDSYTF